MGAAIGTQLAAATSAVTNRFVASVNMANGAYTIANASPSFAGGVLIVATITGVTGNDTPGSILVTGTDLNGNVISETIALVAGGTATGTKVFRTVTSIVQSGWVINGGNDTIVIGHGAGSFVSGSSGTVFGVIVNTTAAGAVTITDGAGKTIATLKSSIAEGAYNFGPGVDFTGYLKVALAAASDVTVIHTPQSPAAA